MKTNTTQIIAVAVMLAAVCATGSAQAKSGKRGRRISRPTRSAYVKTKMRAKSYSKSVPRSASRKIGSPTRSAYEKAKARAKNYSKSASHGTSRHVVSPNHKALKSVEKATRDIEKAEEELDAISHRQP